MEAAEDKSASQLGTKQRLLQPHVTLEHPRKHQLEPTRSDLTNPAGGEEWHGMQQSLMDEGGYVDNCMESSSVTVRALVRWTLSAWNDGWSAWCEFSVRREQCWRGCSAELTVEGDDWKYDEIRVERPSAIDRPLVRWTPSGRYGG
jgi:hypothetical protein